MTAFILLATVSLLTAAIGCALIWGFDMRRADEIERGFPPPAPRPELSASERHSLDAGARD